MLSFTFMEIYGLANLILCVRGPNTIMHQFEFTVHKYVMSHPGEL